MASAKLYYYPATGKGNQIRLALAAGNIEFEDVFPSSGYPPNEEQVLAWRKIGGNTTTNVPMLEMPNGKVYTQSSAIMRAVGRMSNLVPQSDDDMYKMDKLIADAEDLRSASYKTFVSWGATKDSYLKFIHDTIPLHFENLERQLVEGGGDYFVLKDKLTIADICVYDAVTNFGNNRCAHNSFEKFPHLAKWVELMESDPGIASYLAGDKYAKVYKFGPESI